MILFIFVRNNFYSTRIFIQPSDID
ncbi:uncharacterized protein METZ01_LOCUS133973 [marine metagenome]|uniref:Uncharacterized protein n=1 Tax=marine metagenome TaxID=408172 RepID=A0A381YVY3_9ZZZZ